MIYLDTSSFLDLYLERDGVDQIKKELTSRKRPIILSPFLEMETHSVLGRLVSNKLLTKHSRHEVEQRIMSDLGLGFILSISIKFDDVKDKLFEITNKKGYKYRTMDTVHVISAMLSKAELFIGSDKEQLKLAKQEGLKYLLVDKKYKLGK